MANERQSIAGKITGMILEIESHNQKIQDLIKQVRVAMDELAKHK